MDDAERSGMGSHDRIERMNLRSLAVFGLSWARVLIVIGITSVILAVCVSGLVSSQRASNERNASTALKTLESAEADFRATDRDGNHVNDFWTGDVSGLYYVKSADLKLEIRLIEESLANADSKPLFPLTTRGSRKGYSFLALDRDESVAGAAGEYKVDTDHSGRKVHNASMFGFCAFPESDWAGAYQFKVNENNTIFREPPAKPRNTFPSDEELKRYWSDMD